MSLRYVTRPAVLMGSIHWARICRKAVSTKTEAMAFCSDDACNDTESPCSNQSNSIQKALCHTATLIILGLGVAAGCNDRATTEASRSATQTTGDEGIVTTDSDGEQWVTPDVQDAREKASENSAEDVDETGLVSPINVPGLNEEQ